MPDNKCVIYFLNIINQFSNYCSDKQQINTILILEMPTEYQSQLTIKSNVADDKIIDISLQNTNYSY